MSLEPEITWRTLVGSTGPDSLSPLLAASLDWSVEVHERFFGPGWLPNALRRRDVPFLDLSLWPVSGPSRLLRSLERACLLSVAEPHWAQLRPQASGSSPSQAWDHLRLVLDVIGMATRAAMTVNVEPQGEGGRRPDLLLSQACQQTIVEVTCQYLDNSFRSAESYGHSVDEHVLALGMIHGVVVEVRSEEVFPPDEVTTWFELGVLAAATVKATGTSQVVQRGANRMIVHPAGTHVDTPHDGPPIEGDGWPRLERRLVEKADQTSGGPPAWIRVEVHPALFELTSLHAMTPAARLAALLNNVQFALADHTHVLGVLLGLRPGPQATDGIARALLEDGTITPISVATDDDGDAAPSALEPALLQIPLAGGWLRRTYILPNPPGQLRHERAFDPSRLFAQEGTWLPWALERVGQPSVEALLR